ncbi:MAG: glycosyltransferase family 4 protein [Candidatus Binatia bacterium]
MEILVITWNYPPRRGGIENLIGSLCEELSKVHSVKVITSHAPVSGAHENNVFRSPLPGLIFFAFYALWRGAVLLARNPQLRVVLGGSVLVTPLVLILTRLFARRAVIQAHGLDLIYRSLLYQQLCVRWLKSSDGVVANSRYTAQLAQLKGVPSDRIAVISPGVQLERFSKPTDIAADKRAWGVEGKRIILFVGRLAKRKGVKEFIENSFVSVVQAVPDAVFLIVGDNPTESLTNRDDVASEIKAAIASFKFEDHVRLLGSLSDEEVIKLYQACDLVVLPALDIKDDVEGFGIVALEAAAASKPVVATRVGGIPDAVEEGKSGALVDPGDYIGLSQIVTSTLKDRELSLSMGFYGRCRINKDFAWRRVIGFYEGVFNAAIRELS